MEAMKKGSTFLAPELAPAVDDVPLSSVEDAIPLSSFEDAMPLSSVEDAMPLSSFEDAIDAMLIVSLFRKNEHSRSDRDVRNQLVGFLRISFCNGNNS
jgi:hypothetical protein